MTDIFTSEIRSFRLIRPKDKKGKYKDQVTYVRPQADVVFLPLVNTQDDIFTSLKNLFGQRGTMKSFYRYYYPKRFVWVSTLYPRPRVAEFIDEKTKNSMVFKNIPGFRGSPKNRIYDHRNIIVDYTDLINTIVPFEKNRMIRSTVINCVENIYPEILSFILFHNSKHDGLKDVDDESIEDFKKSLDLINELQGEDLDEPVWLDSFLSKRNVKDPYELSNEEYKRFSDIANSTEAFDENLLAQTKIFNLGGPTLGIDQHGFNRFIISFPIKLKIHRYWSLQFLRRTLNLQRYVKINPELIYEISFVQFITEAYECYYNNTTSSNEFINEVIKRNVTFHLYSTQGTGFIINFKELKESLKWKPIRFIRMMSSRLSMLSMLNVGSISDADIDKLESDETDNEFDKVTASVKKDSKITDTFKSDMKAVTDDDLYIETVKDKDISEDSTFVEEEENVEIDTTSDDTLKTSIFTVKDAFKVKKTVELPSKTEIIPSRKDLMNASVTNKKLNDLMNSFSKATPPKKNYIIKDESGFEMKFSDHELDDILSETEEVDDDTEIIDNTIEEDIDTEEEDDIVEIEKEKMKDDPESVIERIASEYSEVDDDIVEEEEFEDDEYTTITPKTVNGAVKLKSTIAKQPKLSKADEKRINILKEKYKSIDINGTKVDDIIGNSKKIDIPRSVDKKLIPKAKDKGVENMGMMDYQRAYVKNNYQPDIINAVRGLSVNKETPMYMTDVKIDDTSDQFTNKTTYTFTLKDEHKKTHKLKFDMPKLDENGLLKIGGNEKFIKKQLIRRPIVKIAPDKVYITTQLNSYIVYRDGVLLNKGSEVIRKLFNVYLVDNPKIQIERGDCLEDNKDYITTLEYDALAKNFYTVLINMKDKYGDRVEIFFSQTRIRNKLKEMKIRTSYKDDIIPDNILPLAINYTKNMLYSIDMSKNSSINSTIITLLNDALKDEDMMTYVKSVKSPKRRICTMAEIQSKQVPLISFANYTFGWDRVQTYFKENEIEFSPTAIRSTKKLAIKFNDGFLYYNQYPVNGAIFLNGFTKMNTEDYKYEDLNNPALYLDYLQKTFNTKNIVKGWVTVRESMLDFKTLQILEALNLPTDLLEIFLYCNDLLVDNNVKPESDISNFRIRGNEIVSDCLYKVLTDHYNKYRKRTGKTLTLSIPQNAVMSAVYKTEILENYNALSPAAELKAYNTTTYKGPGGTKMNRAFSMEKRAYNDSYYGTFGISTADNQNAGIVKELTINPKIDSTLGFIGKQDNQETLGDIATVEEALIPNVLTIDDPSRIAFVSIQTAHVGGLPDSSLPPVRTGYERSIQFQCGENFCKKAKKDGKVTSVNDDLKKVYISYDDGSKDCIDYNNVMLKNSDAYNESFFDCLVKEGQKVKAEEPLVADGRFFKRDPISKDLIYTQSRSAMVAIAETSGTEDDSSIITDSLSRKLNMNITKRKQISIKPTDMVIEYVGIGEHVELGDPIFTFDESGTLEASADDLADFDEMFKEFDKSTLKEMIHQTPKANLSGKVVDMKVYWTVPLEKMSSSVQALVKSYISRVKKDIIAEEKFTGIKSPKRELIDQTKMESGRDRINGCQVDMKLGGVVIEYFISTTDKMSNGDKLTFNSALKSIVADVIEGDVEPYTENGIHVDAISSFISNNARMINSGFLNGFTGKILYDFSKRWAINFLKEAGQPVPKMEYEDKIPIKFK